MTAAPPVSADPPADDAQAVRTAAQWLVAAAGAVGATLIAGLQIGDVGKLAGAWPVLAVAVLAFGTALAVVGQVIRAAGRVLVVSRVTVSDLLREESGQRVAGRRRLRIEPGAAAPDHDLALVHRQILEEQAWLLPDDDSVAALYAGKKSRELDAVCVFARNVLTRLAYQRLNVTVTGWPGRVFLVAVLVFAVALGWPVPTEVAVTTAYPVQVLLNGDPAVLRAAGLSAGCTAGMRLTGVALGGSLTAPEVVTETLGGCPAARFTVTREVGLPFAQPS